MLVITRKGFCGGINLVIKPITTDLKNQSIVKVFQDEFEFLKHLSKWVVGEV